MVRSAPSQGAIKKLSGGYSSGPDYDKGYGTAISDYQPYLYEKDGNYPKEYVDVEYDHNKPYDLSKVPHYNRYRDSPSPPSNYYGQDNYPRNYENKQYQPYDYNYKEKNYEDNYNNYYKINLPYQMRDNRRWDDYGKPDYGKPDYGKPDYGRPDYGRPDYGKPDYGRPDYGRPDYGKPDYGRPDYGRPDYGKPDYGKPGYGGGYDHKHNYDRRRNYRSVPEYYGPEQYYPEPYYPSYYEPNYQVNNYNDKYNPAYNMKDPRPSVLDKLDWIKGRNPKNQHHQHGGKDYDNDKKGYWLLYVEEA